MAVSGSPRYDSDYSTGFVGELLWRLELRALVASLCK